MRLLAIDPGKLSGWATWDDGVFDCGQLPHFEMIDAVWERVATFDVVVVESYLITAATLRKSRGENWSLSQIGCFEWMVRRAGVGFTLQSPAEAKSFATDDKLRRVGWYRPGLPHARDAARHLLVRAVALRLVDITSLLPDTADDR